MSETDTIEKFPEAKEVSSEQIAEFIFSKPPQEPCTIQIFADENDDEYIFQLLLNIFMEGLAKNYNNLDNIDLGKFSENFDKHIPILEKFIHSVGFNLKIEKLDRTNENKEHFDDYYCRVGLRQVDWFDFQRLHIEKNYHFFVNHRNIFRDLAGVQNVNPIVRTCLPDYYAIFYNQGKVYKIGFSHYKFNKANVVSDMAEKKMAEKFN
jgi:hypothetical protein